MTETLNQLQVLTINQLINCHSEVKKGNLHIAVTFTTEAYEAYKTSKTTRWYSYFSWSWQLLYKQSVHKINI